MPAFHILLLLYYSFLVTSTDVPLGHLKPFGNHKLPTVDIDEFTKETAPRPQEFYEKYMKPSKAAIFRGAITDSRAYKLWTDAYLRENYGENEVRLEGKKEKKHVPPAGEKYLGRDTLRHFIDTYHQDGNVAYVVSDLPQAMYKDVDVLPSVGACGEMLTRIVEVDIWWSGGGSSSIIHKDAFNQINCLINGTKYWKLIEYKYEKDMYQYKEREEGYGGFSRVDPTKVDLVKFPNVQKVEWSNITVHAGDCLFLPKSYYHQVESSGTHNLAVSLLITRYDDRDSLNFSDCTDETDYDKPKTLDNYDVQLVWKGNGTMVMGRPDLEVAYRKHYSAMTAEFEKRREKIDFETWYDHFQEEEEDTLRIGDVKKGFEIMDKDKDGFLTTSDVNMWTLKDLQDMNHELEPFEPSNEYTFEYSIISFDHVWNALQQAKRHTKVLTRKNWLKVYTGMGGTKDFADEIFYNLSKGKEQILMNEIQPIDIWNALEKRVKYWAPQYSDLGERPTKRAFGIEDDKSKNSGAYGEL